MPEVEVASAEPIGSRILSSQAWVLDQVQDHGWRMCLRAFHSSHMLPTVYILANRKRGTLYIGVTSDPNRRLHQHRSGTGSRFAQRYGLRRLVYFEHPLTMYDALARERQLKAWRRPWKVALIESVNPEWNELFPQSSRLESPENLTRDPELDSGSMPEAQAKGGKPDVL